MLVERDPLVDALRSVASGALRGDGRLVFVGGGAGIGKTTVLAEFVRRMPEELAVRRGGCDNDTTPAALGPLLEAMPEIEDDLRRDEPERPATFRRLLAMLDETPTVLLLEDVHWADEATLQFLRFVGRRIEHRAVLIVATYRSDEVSSGHPLTVTLGELAAAAGVTRLSVAPLSVMAVTALCADAGARLDPVALHRITDGNPFFVTEALASGAPGMPPTVRDAVLARVAALSPAGRSALDAAAVLGAGASTELVHVVSSAPLTALDECLALGVLVRTGDDIGFRHEHVEKAHAADLATQGAHGVNYLRYWVDESHGKIFCLVDAPDAEAASTVHREAHGLVADEIFAVAEGV